MMRTFFDGLTNWELCGFVFCCCFLLLASPFVVAAALDFFTEFSF